MFRKANESVLPLTSIPSNKFPAMEKLFTFCQLISEISLKIKHIL